MKKYNSAAVAIALGISELAIEDRKGMTIAEILILSENTKLKKYDEEAAKIRDQIKALKEENNNEQQ